MRKLKITVNKEGTAAVCRELPPGTTSEEMAHALEAIRIREGILWDEINEALELARVTETAIASLLVARVSQPIPARILTEDGTWVEVSLCDFIEAVSRIHCLLSDSDELTTAPPAIFVRRDRAIVRIPRKYRRATVYGPDDGSIEDPDAWVRTSESVGRVKDEEGSTYIAGATGYVGLTHERRLVIHSGIEMSSDKMEMFVRLLPLRSGHAEVSSLLGELATWSNNQIAVSAPDKAGLEILTKNGPVSYPVRKGIAPIHGTEGMVEFCIDTALPEPGADDQRTARDISPLTIVKQGRLVAVITPGIQGVPGMNCAGEIVPATEGKPIHLAIGDNLMGEDRSGRIHVFASQSGLLRRRDDRIDVARQLHIDGCVGPETGNFHFPGDVLVKGSILSGYTVECDGNLIVRESIEDGVHLRCHKDLTVNKGIYGTTGRIEVTGNATVGFLQLTAMTIHGNLTVENYIYQSNVFCNGSLQVLGRRLYKDSPSAVVGGSVASMKMMAVHSAGTYTSPTALSCGINPEYYTRLMELRELTPVLKKKFSLIQNRIGLNLNGANIVQRLQSMPKHQKTVVLKLLGEMKRIVTVLDQTEAKKRELERKALSPGTEGLVIVISTHMVPDLRVRLREHLYPIRQEFCGAKFLLRGSEVVMAPLN